MIALRPMTERGRPTKQRPRRQPHSAADRETHIKGIAERLRSARERQSWTSVDLAHSSGVTASAIRKLEEGKGDPKSFTLKLLAQALGVPAGWLAYGG